jgi:hypothetical protein
MGRGKTQPGNQEVASVLALAAAATEGRRRESVCVWEESREREKESCVRGRESVRLGDGDSRRLAKEFFLDNGEKVTAFS